MTGPPGFSASRPRRLENRTGAWTGGGGRGAGGADESRREKLEKIKLVARSLPLVVSRCFTTTLKAQVSVTSGEKSQQTAFGTLRHCLRERPKSLRHEGRALAL